MSYRSIYTGAQIDSILGNVESGAPLYMEGMMFVLNNNFYGGAPLSGNVTITSADSGVKKMVYDRFMNGIPDCLLVPVCAYGKFSDPFSAVPFVLESASRIFATSMISLSYRNAVTIGNAVSVDYFITVSVNCDGKSVTVSTSSAAKVVEPDNSALLPFKTHIVVAQDGSVTPNAQISASASSSGDDKLMFDRFQKGIPPAVAFTMQTATAGDRTIWLYLDSTNTSGSPVYLSGTLSNGVFSGKRAKLQTTLSSSRVSYRASLIDAS